MVESARYGVLDKTDAVSELRDDVPVLSSRLPRDNPDADRASPPSLFCNDPRCAPMRLRPRAVIVNEGTEIGWCNVDILG